MGSRRWGRALVAIGLGLGLCGLTALGCGRPPAASELSLIWISLDTLRADHLGLYGYPRDTSPFLDELGRRGLYFDWAISPQNSTLPSHMTMFTGRHPIVHGVMHARRGLRLADPVKTLPELLREAGFETRGWVDGGKMRAYFGFDRGFDVYDDAAGPLPEKLEQARRWLAERDPQRRFFCLIHTYAVHQPYDPPAPYDERYPPADERSSARALARYDGAIRFVDDQLREFVAALEELGTLDRTILVITSDHGESFEEFGIDHVGHEGFNLHQNITRVPWIVRHPDPAYRGRIDQAVGLIDFPNTMLALLGSEERLPGGGVNVLAGLYSAETDPRSYLSWTGEGQLDGQTTDAWSLYHDGYHLLRSPLDTPSRNALYHVASDPQEMQPLAEGERRSTMETRLAQKRRALEQASQRLTSELRAEGTLPKQLEEELRALGYVD